MSAPRSSQPIIISFRVPTRKGYVHIQQPGMTTSVIQVPPGAFRHSLASPSANIMAFRRPTLQVLSPLPTTTLHRKHTNNLTLLREQCLCHPLPSATPILP